MPLTVQEFLTRVQQALDGRATLYWLGAGGYYGALSPSNHPPQEPGTMVQPQALLADLRTTRPDRYREYMEAASAAGIDPGALPSRMPACDCSGFVLWALKMPRAPSASAQSGWINTDAIYGDARGRQVHFKNLGLFSSGVVLSKGDLLVYRSSPPREEHGHVGVVTDLDPHDKVPLVAHCSSTNYLLEPLPGRERTSIRATDPKVFKAHPQTLVVRCLSVQM